MEITSKQYWQDYYQASPEDKQKIVEVCGRYDKFWDMWIKTCKNAPTTLIEIGAFPGRYLAYLSARYGLRSTGLDFNPDEAKFVRSMQAMGLSDFDYECADFLEHQPVQHYDLVFSNGFIEHFTNFDEVLDKHLQYLKPGGAMMVMIPNKRFLRSVYGDLVDRDNQRAHNLKCMSLSVFEAFAERNGLKLVYLGYYGGFPFKVHGSLSTKQKLIYHPVRVLAKWLDPLLMRFPNKWWSSAIICICYKDE